MSISVFVSHSTWPRKDLDPHLLKQVPAHAAFRTLLCKRLAEDPEINVLVDETIPVGRYWRELLFDGIADCHAAIVLVNEQALLSSPWVDTEVKVLAYRAYHERDEFALMLVPFGGVTADRIAKHSPWEPVAVGELQMLPRHGLDIEDKQAVDEVINQISTILNQLRQYVQGDTKSGWLVDRLCALLDIDTAVLEKVGKSLRVDTRGITELVLRRRIAHAIYREGPPAIRRLLEHPQTKLPYNALREMLEILGTYWVELEASMGLLFCPEAATRRAVAINGRELAYTPRTYVRQVCSEQYPWPVLIVDPTRDVIGQIRDTLVQDYFEEQLSHMHADLRFASQVEITRSLNRLLASENSVPVFIAVLQEGGGDIDSLMTKISAVFPQIRVIICTATELGAAVLPPSVRMLRPEFSLVREAAELNTFSAAGTHLGNIRNVERRWKL